MRYFVDTDGSVRSFSSVRAEVDENIREVGLSSNVKQSPPKRRIINSSETDRIISCSIPSSKKNISITDIEELITEANKKTIDDIYKAIVKNGQFFNKDDMNSKMLSLTPMADGYICPECNEYVPFSFKNISQHRNIHREEKRPKEPKVVHCDFCKAEVSVQKYKKHLHKVHKKKSLPRRIKEIINVHLKSNNKQNKPYYLKKKKDYDSNNDRVTIGEILGSKVPFVKPVIERQPVENQHQIRDNGQFGSMPLYDNMD